MKLYILFVSNQILNLTINHGRFRGYPARHGTWATPLIGHLREATTGNNNNNNNI